MPMHVCSSLGLRTAGWEPVRPGHHVYDRSLGVQSVQQGTIGQLQRLAEGLLSEGDEAANVRPG